MRVELIDVDGHRFPNLPLMKISAWHKQQGDCVEWHNPLTAWLNPPDRVYMSKVFTFTPDYQHPVNAKEIIKGGTGYSYPDGGAELPEEIEHIYPDYAIYFDRIPEVRETAYGFLTRGCPRGCEFCIVGQKEGRAARKVADLSEFWRGQKNIVLLDPNMFACKEWRGLSDQLIDSGAWVDFSQGCDIRIMTKETAEYIKRMKIKQVHFAWDRYEDKEKIVPKFKEFKEITQWDYRKLGVYVLCNFNTTFEQDLERVYTLRELGYNPYVMLYEKDKIPAGHRLKRLQRWVNNRIFPDEYSILTPERLEEYKQAGWYLQEINAKAEQPLNMEIINDGRALVEEEREIIWALMLEGLTEQQACEEYFLTHHTDYQNTEICYLPAQEILAEAIAIFGER